MKEFNEQLHKDVTLLKKLRAKKDKTEYKKFFTVIMRRHTISKTTLQAEIRKDTPGAYRSMNWQMRYRPITDEEIHMVYELLQRQFTIEHIKQIMERRLGGNFSKSRMERIRVEIEKRSKELEANSETTFGKNVSLMFEEFFRLDLMDPNRSHTLKVDGTKYKVSCSVIKDAVELIRLSAEGGGKNIPEIQRTQMELMLARKMEHMMNCPQLPLQEIRAAEIVRRSLVYTNTNPMSFHPDYRVLIATVREFKPDAHLAEIHMHAYNHQERIKGSTENIVPDIKPIKRAAYEEMKRCS